MANFYHYQVLAPTLNQHVLVQNDSGPAVPAEAEARHSANMNERNEQLEQLFRIQPEAVSGAARLRHEVFKLRIVFNIRRKPFEQLPRAWLTNIFRKFFGCAKKPQMSNLGSIMLRTLSMRQCTKKDKEEGTDEEEKRGRTRAPKEAEKAVFPKFPQPGTYRNWRLRVREAVVAAADRPLVLRVALRGSPRCGKNPQRRKCFVTLAGSQPSMRKSSRLSPMF